MIQISEISRLLEQLEGHIADDLEGQELDLSSGKTTLRKYTINGNSLSLMVLEYFQFSSLYYGTSWLPLKYINKVCQGSTTQVACLHKSLIASSVHSKTE